MNRVDEIIVFHRLGKDHLATIVEIQLDHLRTRLAERSISLEVADAAKQYLARKGYDPVYGARPLKRLIQREIENELALKLLEGTFGDGDAVLVDVREESLVLEKTQPPLAA